MDVRRLIGLTSVAILAVLGSPSRAAAAPLEDQWVFKAWEIEDLWTQSRGDGITIAIVESGVTVIPDIEGAMLPGVDLADGSTDGRQGFSLDGHGTAMTAMIASDGSGTGALGIAPGAKVLPVTMDHAKEIVPPAQIAGAIRWAADHGARVINMSFAAPGAGFPGGCPDEVQRAVAYAVSKGAIAVAGAGNDGDTTNSVAFPAACRGVLSVGAVDSDAKPWSKSQRQPYVDVAAPGVGILSPDDGGRLELWDGTSSAAALTSGALALVWGAHPELSNRQVVARVLATLRDPAPEGQKDSRRGYGTVVPQRAISADVPDDAPNPVFDELKELPGPTPSASEGPGMAAPPDRRNGSPSSDDGGLPGWVIGSMVGGGALLVVIVAVMIARRRPRNVGPPQYPYPYQNPR